jgi:hypothetical protein
VLALLRAWALLALTCAHAQPASGNRDPDAGMDPDYPEQNCRVNNTADCRPGSAL